jgi:DNA-binding transcriptional LysR family regulator
MELRHLRYFCAVAKEQSFTIAARRLHVSQSGVSGQVRDLEKELAVSLFRRNQRNVSLTPEGAIFLREARDILDHADRAMEAVVSASQGRYGKLSIGLCGPATAPFLPRLIRVFRKQQPGVTLSLKDLDPVRQPQALVNREIDIGFTRGLPAAFRGALRSEVLFHERLVAAVPRGHSLQNAESISLHELAKDPFVLYARENAPELFDAIISLCKRARFSPRIVDSPGVWQSVLTMVEAGEGISVLPSCVQHLRSQDVVFKPLNNRGCDVEVVLAWRKDDPDAIREGFVDLLRGSRSEIERLLKQR